MAKGRSREHPLNPGRGENPSALPQIYVGQALNPRRGGFPLLDSPWQWMGAAPVCLNGLRVIAGVSRGIGEVAALGRADYNSCDHYPGIFPGKE